MRPRNRSVMCSAALVLLATLTVSPPVIGQGFLDDSPKLKGTATFSPETASPGASVELKLELMKLKAQVGEKLSEQDFDPAIMKISAGLAEARELAQRAAEAAGENWEKMQQSAMDALDELNEALDEAERRNSS